MFCFLWLEIKGVPQANLATTSIQRSLDVKVFNMFLFCTVKTVLGCVIEDVHQQPLGCVVALIFSTVTWIHSEITVRISLSEEPTCLLADMVNSSSLSC